MNPLRAFGFVIDLFPHYEAKYRRWLEKERQKKKANEGNQ